MLLPSVRSRPGLDEFSLGLNLFTAEFQLALDEIGPMTRNPERDTERSRVVRARSPSLVVVHYLCYILQGGKHNMFTVKEAEEFVVRIGRSGESPYRDFARVDVLADKGQ